MRERRVKGDMLAMSPPEIVCVGGVAGRLSHVPAILVHDPAKVSGMRGLIGPASSGKAAMAAHQREILMLDVSVNGEDLRHGFPR